MKAYNWPTGKRIQRRFEHEHLNEKMEYMGWKSIKVWDDSFILYIGSGAGLKVVGDIIGGEIVAGGRHWDIVGFF